METKKIIAVAGATGHQGSGLVRAILNDSGHEFVVRAITRDINNDKAKKLAEMGAEVVSADIGDPESLQKAFRGAYGAYCVTFYWDYMSPEKELSQAKALAGASKQAGVKHVIWSTLDDTRKYIPISDTRMPTLMGKYKVPHFDAKGEANHFFTDLGLPVTLFHTVFYWDNFIQIGMGPRRGPDGKLAITLPMGDKRLPGIASEDIGKCALGVFKGGEKYIGKSLGITGGNLTIRQIADSFARVIGEEVLYKDVPPEVYRNFGFPGADDLANMFQFKHDFEKEYCGSRSIELSKALNPDLLTFDKWLEKNKNQIQIS